MDYPNPSDSSSYLQFPPVSESCSSAELASDSSDRERKRNAKYGQWRTPPQPFFPSSSGVAIGTVAANPAVPLAAPSTEPDVSGLDLASLQEAYRRGMAAAAALSKHQRETGQIVLGNVDQICTDGDIISSLNTVQSCPNFLLMPPQQQATVNSSISGTIMSSKHVPHQPNTTQQYVPVVPYAAAAPTAAVPSTSSTRTTAASPTVSHHALAPTVAPSAVPTIPIPVATVKAIPAVTRSFSLPDIAKGGVTNVARPVSSASTEEEKRIKRLARNRASARLRRLRKKNLVESYEEQVAVLEQSLAKLHAHKWGDPESNNSALIDALSMERGQQPLTAENRREVIKQILEQQKEQVKNLMDVQMEGWMLRWLATQCQQQQQQQQQPAVGNIGVEEHLLADELQNVLNLSPEQLEQLKKATEGIEEEKHAIDTVNLCLEAMMNNSWLVNQEVEDTIDQFTSIMNQSQISKFLLWTDHNSEAIEQLDFVNAPSETALPENSPNFMFGIDDMMGPHDDMGGDDAASGK